MACRKRQAINASQFAALPAGFLGLGNEVAARSDADVRLAREPPFEYAGVNPLGDEPDLPADIPVGTKPLCLIFLGKWDVQVNAWHEQVRETWPNAYEPLLSLFHL